MEGRRDHHIGLESLALQLCSVTTVELREDLEDLVENVTWNDVSEMGSDYEETESEDETDPGDYEDEDDDIDHGFGYCDCGFYR